MGRPLGSIYTLLIAMAGGKKKTRSAGSPSPSPEMQPISGANPPPHEAGAAPMAVDSLEASGDPGLSAVENPDDDEAGGYPSGASDFLVKFMTTEFGRLRSAQEALKNTEIDDKINQNSNLYDCQRATCATCQRHITSVGCRCCSDRRHRPTACCVAAECCRCRR